MSENQFWLLTPFGCLQYGTVLQNSFSDAWQCAMHNDFTVILCQKNQKAEDYFDSIKYKDYIIIFDTFKKN